MTHAPLVTQRFNLVPWAQDEAHFAHFVRWAGDPRVMRYIGDGSLWDLAGCAERDAIQRERWERLGWGWRFAVERTTGDVVGLAAAQPTTPARFDQISDGEHEVGWWVDPAHWGRGVAVEMGQGLLDEAFDRLGVPYAVAVIQPENLASLGVARKLGFAMVGTAYDANGQDVSVLRARRPEPWAAAPA